MLSELLHDSVRLCAFLIHLVDCNYYGNAGCLGVVNSFYCLRHDSVVSGDNKYCNIRYHCTSESHSGERLVSGGVEEGDIPSVYADSVCADMLSDSSCFGCGDVCVSYSVQKGGLAVVDVSHDNDNRASRLQVLFPVHVVNYEPLLNCHNDLTLNLCAQLLGDQGGSIKINCLILVCHNAECHELFDDLCNRCLEPCCKLRDDNFIGYHNGELELSRSFKL